MRRHQCEQVDEDPLVWTNQRFIRWARNIDLTEYADNLKGVILNFIFLMLIFVKMNKHLKKYLP